MMLLGYRFMNKSVFVSHASVMDMRANGYNYKALMYTDALESAHKFDTTKSNSRAELERVRDAIERYNARFIADNGAWGRAPELITMPDGVFSQARAREKTDLMRGMAGNGG